MNISLTENNLTTTTIHVKKQQLIKIELILKVITTKQYQSINIQCALQLIYKVKGDIIQR